MQSYSWRSGYLVIGTSISMWSYYTVGRFARPIGSRATKPYVSCSRRLSWTCRISRSTNRANSGIRSGDARAIVRKSSVFFGEHSRWLSISRWNVTRYSGSGISAIDGGESIGHVIERIVRGRYVDGQHSVGRCLFIRVRGRLSRFECSCSGTAVCAALRAFDTRSMTGTACERRTRDGRKTFTRNPNPHHDRHPNHTVGDGR